MGILQEIRKGVGVATALLINEGIKVYDENTFFDQNHD